MSDSSRHSPIGGFRYGRGAHDRVRFRDDPIDDDLALFVDGTRPVHGEALRSVRDQLSENDCYTLIFFARRQTVRALREHDLDAAMSAVDALTLVTRSRIDFRDLSVDLPLFAAREAGGDLTAIIDRAEARSEPGTAGVFEATRGRAPSLTLADCDVVRVQSAHGVGLMEAWFRTSRSRANPQVEVVIAEAVVKLADRIDADGDYLVDSMHVSTLPNIWFGLHPGGDTIPTRGSAGLSAAHVLSEGPWTHGLLVFLAEFDSPTRAAELVRAAGAHSTTDRPRTAVQVGRALALFVGGSSTAGEEPLETAASLERFHPLARAVLADVAP